MLLQTRGDVLAEEDGKEAMDRKDFGFLQKLRFLSAAFPSELLRRGRQTETAYFAYACDAEKFICM